MCSGRKGENADGAQISDYQKLLDRFVTHCIRYVIPPNEMNPVKIEDDIQNILQLKEIEIMQANNWNLFRPNSTEYAELLAEDLHTKMLL